MEEPAAATLSSRIAMLSKSLKYRKEGTPNKYSEVADYIWETYTTRTVIAEMDAAFICFLQPSNMTTTEHTKARWSKVPGCHLVYNE